MVHRDDQAGVGGINILWETAMKTAAATLAACAIAALTLPAAADEQMKLLATSGRWIAAAHSASMTAAPDVCVVGTSLQLGEQFAIRADVAAQRSAS